MNRSGRNDETWYDGAQNATYPNPILGMERLLEKAHPLMDDGTVIEIAAPIGKETGRYKFMTKTSSGFVLSDGNVAGTFAEIADALYFRRWQWEGAGYALEKIIKEKEEIPVQILYDLRQKHGFCSGMDLHEFFFKHLGESSPSGYRKINIKIAESFFMQRCASVETSGLFEAMKMARAEWGRAVAIHTLIAG